MASRKPARRAEGEAMLDQRPRLNNSRKTESLKGQTFFDWDGMATCKPPTKKAKNKDQEDKVQK